MTLTAVYLHVLAEIEDARRRRPFKRMDGAMYSTVARRSMHLAVLWSFCKRGPQCAERTVTV